VFIKEGEAIKISIAIKRNNKNSVTELKQLHNDSQRALWILKEWKDSGYDSSLSIEEIREALEDFEFSVYSPSIGKAFNRAGNMIIRNKSDSIVKYKIAQPGRQLLDNILLPSAMAVHYIEPGKQWTARNKLGELGKTLKGELLISDRYYGKRTANILAELLESNTKIRFLTSQTSEDTGTLKIVFSDLIRENKGLEMRIYPNRSELHDRYILSENALIIIGHGIKDLGGSESFVVRFGPEIAGDVMSMLRSTFENRWKRSVNI